MAEICEEELEEDIVGVALGGVAEGRGLEPEERLLLEDTGGGAGMEFSAEVTSLVVGVGVPPNRGAGPAVLRELVLGRERAGLPLEGADSAVVEEGMTLTGKEAVWGETGNRKWRC